MSRTRRKPVYREELEEYPEAVERGLCQEYVGKAVGGENEVFGPKEKKARRKLIKHRRRIADSREIKEGYW